VATADRLKQRLRDGEVVVALRVPVKITRPALETALGRAHYDLLYVDGQHTAFTEDNLVAVSALAEALDLPLQLRLPHTRHTYLIGRYLDFGPTAIMVPEVSQPTEVEEAVAYAYYPPIGKRSWGGVARRGLAAGRDRLAYAAWWNETVVLGIQLESVAAIAGAYSLVKPGVDYIAFGPSDLSFSLEANPEFRWRTVDDCMRAVAEQVAGTGVRLGMAIATRPEERERYLAMGLTMFQEHPR
jgi:4-hydroxy-2-oxoheptanedioate aldolase